MELQPIIYTSTGIFSGDEVEPLLKQLVETVYLTEQGSMRIVTPFSRIDVEESIEGFADGLITLPEALRVAHDQQIGGAR